MSYTAIVDAVKTAIGSVSGVVGVHVDREFELQSTDLPCIDIEAPEDEIEVSNTQRKHEMEILVEVRVKHASTARATRETIVNTVIARLDDATLSGLVQGGLKLRGISRAYRKETELPIAYAGIRFLARFRTEVTL